MYLSLLSGHLLSCNWVSRVGEGEAIPTLNCEPVVIGRLLEAYLGLPSGNISCSSICSHLNINSDRSLNNRSLFLSMKPLTSYVTLAINKKSKKTENITLLIKRFSCVFVLLCVCWCGVCLAKGVCGVCGCCLFLFPFLVADVI